jgi:hypothetical protein
MRDGLVLPRVNNYLKEHVGSWRCHLAGWQQSWAWAWTHNILSFGCVKIATYLIRDALNFVLLTCASTAATKQALWYGFGDRPLQDLYGGMGSR